MTGQKHTVVSFILTAHERDILDAVAFLAGEYHDDPSRRAQKVLSLYLTEECQRVPAIGQLLVARQNHRNKAPT